MFPATCQWRYGVAFQPYHDVIQMCRLLTGQKKNLAFFFNAALFNEFLNQEEKLQGLLIMALDFKTEGANWCWCVKKKVHPLRKGDSE